MIVPESEIKEKFKDLGHTAFMVKGSIGVAMVEVIDRVKEMQRVYWEWRKNPNGNISDLLREIASVDAALEDLKKVEGK